MKMSVAVMTSCENAPTTPIGYKMRDRAMMAMVTAVVHLVEVVLEAVIVVAWLEEVVVRWCVITATMVDIWLATVETRL